MTELPTSPTPVPPELVTPPAPQPKADPPWADKRKPPLLPLLFGFLIVITIAAAMGIAYYKTKLMTISSPSPSPTVTATSTPAPSMEPSASPSGSPQPAQTGKSSSKASAKPGATQQGSPTPTPVAQPTLDIRFGNPSANVKQTIDEGAGDGRVINREYSSIQVGQFDEVKSAWSPHVTVCYHIVSNEEIMGKNVKFSLTVDDKVEVEDNLGGYDKLEAGRIYDWCHDVTSSIGKHVARLTLNQDKSVKESSYVNSLGRIDWENLADQIPPNFTLIGPNDEGASGTCVFPQYISDNVSAYANLKIEQKVDGGDWTKFPGDRYCFVGTSGSTHTYISRITDERGNANEQSKTFVLY